MQKVIFISAKKILNSEHFNQWLFENENGEFEFILDRTFILHSEKICRTIDKKNVNGYQFMHNGDFWWVPVDWCELLPTKTVQCTICTDHLLEEDCTKIENVGWFCSICAKHYK